MRKRLIPLSVFLILSLFLFIFSSSLSFPFDFASSLASSPRAFIYSIANASSKPTELEIVKAENGKLLAKLSQMNALKKDNDALRSQFQDTVISSQRLLPARVVGFNGSPDNPTVLLLDQGSRNHIKKGMPVILKHDLIGKIGNVSPWNSELILPFNRNFSTLAVTSENNSPGIINGEEDFILLNHVVITDTISKNDIVVTKGEKDKNGVGVPPDLIIGKITALNKSETQPFQSAVVKSVVNFKKLTTIFVIVQ